MDRLTRVLLLAAAAAQLRVAWLIWKRLGDGSICDYPSDCLQWWFPATHELVLPMWLLGAALSTLATGCAWRAQWSGPALTIVGGAGVAAFTAVAVTPIVGGSEPLVPARDGHLWLRAGVEGYRAIALVVAASAVLLAGRRSVAGSAAPVADRRGSHQRSGGRQGRPFR